MPIEVVDISKDHDLPTDAFARIGAGTAKHELKDYGVTTIDGITFSFLNNAYEGRTYFGHEISFTEKGKEIDLIVAQEKNGVVVSLNIFSDITIEGDVKTAHARTYSIVGNKVTKLIDGKYRGEVKKFNKVDDLVGFINKGEHRTAEFERID